ncbi:hypothetical protein Q4488_01080 [Amphritea sp. 1_MG-2023]|uniref:hypothetical protein n=1 Tax=Amphritea sp. 1_MG-2023 TaxID=3062670 RepID=UPI0026E16BF1|nr:hypothetical protein [Amphritea sp. 1_MG-2023]MDO6561965.1 hypothetical protein [Amphritea sp. 1_MG-2023]
MSQWWNKNYRVPHIARIICSTWQVSGKKHRMYQEPFKGPIEEDTMKRIREAWQIATPLGNDMFRDELGSKRALTLWYRCGVPVIVKAMTGYRYGLPLIKAWL